VKDLGGGTKIRTVRAIIFRDVDQAKIFWGRGERKFEGAGRIRLKLVLCVAAGTLLNQHSERTKRGYWKENIVAFMKPEGEHHTLIRIIQERGETGSERFGKKGTLIYLGGGWGENMS